MSKSRFVVSAEIAGTRQHADQVRQALLSQLARTDSQVFEVDLTNVRSMSGAFADELAGRLLSEWRESSPWIVFVTSDDRVWGKIDLALSRRGLRGWVRKPRSRHPVAVGIPEALATATTA